MSLITEAERAAWRAPFDVPVRRSQDVSAMHAQLVRKRERHLRRRAGTLGAQVRPRLMRLLQREHERLGPFTLRVYAICGASGDVVHAGAHVDDVACSSPLTEQLTAVPVAVLLAALGDDAEPAGRGQQITVRVSAEGVTVAVVDLFGTSAAARGAGVSVATHLHGPPTGGQLMFDARTQQITAAR